MHSRHLETMVRFQPPVAVIDLHGEINAFAEQALEEAFARARRLAPTAILLNMSGVDYINSTGIALIVTLMAQARKSGIQFLASGMSEHYMEIFQITRLSDFMSLFADEASALESIRQKA